MQTNNVAQIIANTILQHAFVENDNLIAMEPVLQDHIHDGHGATGPLVFIGFLAGESVYRTIHTVAHRKNAFLKLKTPFAKYFFRRYEKKLVRRISHTLATIVFQYMDTRIRLSTT